MFKHAGLVTLQERLKQVDGGDKRDRTADLLHAMQALSQLSYTPGNEKANYTEPPTPSQCKASPIRARLRPVTSPLDTLQCRCDDLSRSANIHPHETTPLLAEESPRTHPDMGLIHEEVLHLRIILS